MRTNTIRLILTLAALAITFATTSPGQKPHELAGTSWQLVRLQGGDEGTVVVGDGSKYTITFGSDGRVTARVDCNRGSSTWSGSGGMDCIWIVVDDTCQVSSRFTSRSIVTEGANVRTYSIKDGHLFLSGRSGASAYELVPLTTPKRRR